MGVSKNTSIPKWMVFVMQNPMNKWIQMDDLGGKPPLFLVQHPYTRQTTMMPFFYHLINPRHSPLLGICVASGSTKPKIWSEKASKQKSKTLKMYPRYLKHGWLGMFIEGVQSYLLRKCLDVWGL